MINPIDQLIASHPSIDSVEELLHVLGEILENAGPDRSHQMFQTQNGSPDLGLVGVWVLTSRTCGEPHPYDLALSSLNTLAALEVSHSTRKSAAASLDENVAAGRQREAILQELVELPPLKDETLHCEGLLEIVRDPPKTN